MTTGKRALVVRGGWDGHQPVEATDLFIPYLSGLGYHVDVEDSPKIYADADYMAGVDLIMQCMTMSTIEPEEVAGLRAAVASVAAVGRPMGGLGHQHQRCAR